MRAELAEKEPLLDRSGSLPAFMRSNTGTLAEKAPLCPDAVFPCAAFTSSRTSSSGRTLPQAIAHRGYKAAYPENTMASFRGAVNVGAHALETDIHLSRDGVVVLSHDKDLKRCFGSTEKIIDCDWSYLSQLRTVREPRQPMPRLLDLLEYLAEPGQEHVWLLLDIKTDNDPDTIMRLIAATLDAVPVAPGGLPWSQRVLLGIWSAKYLAACEAHLPGYSITCISYTTLYARRFLTVPNVCFNMLVYALMGPFGALFRLQARRAKRRVFAWTVNTERQMRWCIKHSMDGVISDDPKKFLSLCKEAEAEQERLEASALNARAPPQTADPAPRKDARWSTRELANHMRLTLFFFLFGLLFWMRYPLKIDARYKAAQPR